MAKELFFIKTNPVAAKINLYNKICREETQVLGFLKDDKKTSLEIIKNKIPESVESLTQDELISLLDWFKHEYHSDSEEVKTQLFINGIDVFYEIAHQDHIGHFQKVMSDYEKKAQCQLSYTFGCETFKDFLIYGIFYTGMFIQDDENILSRYLREDHRELFSLAEHQFNSDGARNGNPEDLRSYFTDLYDLTKFYKGNIIKLQHD